jgi:kinesin family protein 5
LQESLGGNSKTTMMVAVSPHVLNRPETIRSLRFAIQAKEVKNKARVNKEETRAQLLRRIAELEAQNQKLKTRVIELETSMKDNGFEIELTQELYTTEKKAKKKL